MPLFLVVKCFQCEAFQVQQSKKDDKFKCTLCGIKQSQQRVYAQSAKAADCRKVVQAYNAARGVEDAEDADFAPVNSVENQPSTTDTNAPVAMHTNNDLPSREKVSWHEWTEATEDGIDGDVGCTLPAPHRPDLGAARAQKRLRKQYNSNTTASSHRDAYPETTVPEKHHHHQHPAPLGGQYHPLIPRELNSKAIQQEYYVSGNSQGLPPRGSMPDKQQQQLPQMDSNPTRPSVLSTTTYDNSNLDFENKHHQQKQQVCWGQSINGNSNEIYDQNQQQAQPLGAPPPSVQQGAPRWGSFLEEDEGY